MILFYPYECNLIITLLEVYKEWRVFDGGTWGMLKIPEQRYGGKAHPQCNNNCGAFIGVISGVELN